MKHYFKKTNVFLYICLALFAYSCSEENDFIKKNRVDFTVKEKSFKAALDMPVFTNAYSKLAKKTVPSTNTDLARTALEEQFGFMIVPDSPVKIITKEDGTVYFTILIERNEKEDLRFENLIMKVFNEETSAAIFKYTLNEKGIISRTGDYTIKGIESTLFTDLNIEGKMFFNSGGETCFDISVILCDVADHRAAGHIATSDCWAFFNNNENATNIYLGTSVVCMNPDGGGSESGSGNNPGGTSSNNNGGLGANTNGGNEIITSPISCKTGNCIEAADNVIINDPCKELQELLKSNDTIVVNPYTQLEETLRPANLKTKIDTIATQMNPTTEHGFTLKYTRANHKYNGTYIVGDPISLSVNLFLENSTYGGIHLHPSESGPYPSFGDLVWLLDCYEEAYDYNKGKAVSIIVVNNPFQNGPPTITYALKIDDYLVFKQKVEQKLNCGGCTPEQKDLRIREILRMDAIKYGPNKSTHEKKFLEMNAAFSVSLYKANQAITNWSKLKIVGNIVVPEPCNN